MVRNWLIAFGVIAGALLVGVVLDMLLAKLLRSEPGSTHRVRGSLASALRGQPEIWAVLIAIAVYRPFDFIHSRSLIWLDRVTIALAVVSVTLFLARLAGWLIRAYLSKESVDAPSGSIFVNLARMVIWAVGLIVMLGSLGVQIGPLIASLGVVGIAVSLGLQDTLANFFAGLQITLSRQIQPSQYIRLATAQEGLVTDVTWRNTTLLSPNNNLVVIPNAVIATSLITNYTAGDEEHVEVIPFTVAFGSDLEAVKQTALKVASEVRDRHAAAVKEFEPSCGFRVIAPEGVTASVTIRVKRFQDRLPIVSDLIERLHYELGEMGVEFGKGIVAPARPPV